jgi:hypothetical protein
MEEVSRQRGLAVWRNGSDDARIVMAVGLQQLPATLGCLVPDFGTECVVAGVAQPGDVLAAPAAPIEHVHLVSLKTEPLARFFEIADDLGIRPEGRKFCFRKGIVVVAHFDLQRGLCRTLEQFAGLRMRKKRRAEPNPSLT